MLSGVALDRLLTFWDQLAQARCRGKWVHVGRVNSLRRVTHFEQAADSFDGGQFSMFPDTYIPRYLERLRYRQESLWQL